MYFKYKIPNTLFLSILNIKYKIYFLRNSALKYKIIFFTRYYIFHLLKIEKLVINMMYKKNKKCSFGQFFYEI